MSASLGGLDVAQPRDLEVADPARFFDALVRGVGPAKAFGCGLMLVRRVG